MGRNVTQQPIPYTPLVAGETLAAGDVISQYASDNKAYTSKYLPFATTANQGSAIYANTGLTIGTNFTNYNKQQILQATDGSIFTLEPQASAATGLVIKKYTSTGVFVISTTITSASTYVAAQMAFLSSGDIALVALQGASVNYAIVTNNLVTVKAITSLGSTSTSTKMYLLPSTGGGFSVVTLLISSPNLYITTINNAGTITTASTSIQTNFTSFGNFSAAMLSSGNIAIAYSSDTVNPQYAIYTTAAVAVKAWANLPSGTVVAYTVDMASVPGYFAVVYGGSSGAALIAVFNNAGTQQGSSVSPSTPTLGTNGTNQTNKFTTDGTNFYWIVGSASLLTAKITTAGVLTAGPTSIGITACTGLDSYWDTKTSSLVVVSFSANIYTFFYISASSWSTSSSVNYYTLTLTSGGYGNGGYQGVILGVDGSCLMGESCVNSLAAMYFGSIKPYNSSIIGVAAGAAASGSTVYVNSAVGNYATTTATSTTGVKFNHSTAPILGAAGQVFPNTINIQTPTIRNIN